MDDEIELDYEYDEPCYPSESSSESEEEEIDLSLFECVDEVGDENGVNRVERLKRSKSTDKQQRDDRRRGQRVSRPGSSARRAHDCQPESAYIRVQISSRESSTDRRQRIYARSRSPRDPINERSAMKNDKSDSEMAGRATRSPGPPSHDQPCKIKAASHSFFPSPPKRDSRKSVQRHPSGNIAQREMLTIRHEPPRVPPPPPKRRFPSSSPERHPPPRSSGMIPYHSETHVERNSPPVRFFSSHSESTNRPSWRKESLLQRSRVSELHDAPSTDGYRSRDQSKSNLGTLADEMKREANEKSTPRDGRPSASPNDERTRKDQWKSASREILRRTAKPEATRRSTSKEESSFSSPDRNTDTKLHQRLDRIQAADTKKFSSEQRLIQEFKSSPKDPSYRDHGIDNDHDIKPRISAVNARQNHVSATSSTSSRKLDFVVEKQPVKDRKTQSNLNRNIDKTVLMVSSKQSTNENLKRKALLENQRSIQLKVANNNVDQSLTRVKRILSPVKHSRESRREEEQGSKTNQIRDAFEVTEAINDPPFENDQSNLFLTYSTPQRALDKEEKNRLLMSIAKEIYQDLKKTRKSTDPDRFIRETTPPINETDPGALTPIYSVDSPLSPSPTPIYFDERPLSPTTTNDSIEHTMFTHSIEELVEPAIQQEVLVKETMMAEKPKQKSLEPLVKKVERKRIEGPSSSQTNDIVVKRVHAPITAPSPEPPIKQRYLYAQKANQDMKMKRKSIDMAMIRSQKHSGVKNYFHSSIPSTSQLPENVGQNGISNKRSMFVLASETRAKKRERSFVYENDFMENNRRNVILYDEPIEPPISVFISNAQRSARREVVYADYQDVFSKAKEKAKTEYKRKNKRNRDIQIKALNNNSQKRATFLHKSSQIKNERVIRAGQ